MAIVFFWFGFLKIIDLSPANGLVAALLNKTLPFMSAPSFIIFLGVWEALIGLLFLFPKLTKPALILLIIQMFTTFGPLLFMTESTWQTFPFVPTLEGQYIIKNLVLVALGYLIYVLHQNKTSMPN